MIIIDCLRADHVSHYGYGRHTTPNIDNLSENSLFFENAYTQGTFTLSSAASILTGLYPETHNVLTFHDRLPENFPTLPQLLQSHDYDTSCFPGMGFFSPPWGLDDVGFQRIELMDVKEGEETEKRTCDRISGSFARYLDEVREPFFSLLWFFDLHASFDGVPIPGGERYPPDDSSNAKVNRYDSALVHVDHYVGAILAGLKERGLFDETMIIITSDHGDLFDEHRLLEGSRVEGLLSKLPGLRGKLREKEYLGHLGVIPYDEVIRVPLVIKFPGGEPRGIRRGNVELIDLFPTIMERVNQGGREHRAQGRDLSTAERDPEGGRVVYCSTKPFDWNALMTCARNDEYKYIRVYPPRLSLSSIWKNPRKFVVDHILAGDRLYRCSVDEENDLGAEYAEQRSRLKSLLDQWRKENARFREEELAQPGVKAAEKSEYTEEENKIIQQRLRALGYLE